MRTPAPAGIVLAALRLDRWGSDEVDRRVEEGLSLGVGGFVLFGGVAERVSRLTERIRTDAGRDLWIAADLERGAGQQFRGLTELPPPAALARHPDPEPAVDRAASCTGREALAVGVNWVFAPVLDIDAERDNPIVATRSFSADPEIVARLGGRWIAACQSQGALACAKHFPGHGRTTGDSHIELPVVDVSREELEQDLHPFRAVARDVGSVMVAHVAYPAFGAERAATVSADIVTGVLREGLGFGGLVATDAMIMAGVGQDDAAAAVEALAAGCDVILYPGDVARTVEALERGCGNDPAVARRLEEALEANMAALARYPAAGTAKVTVPPGVGLDLAFETIVDRGSELASWDPARGTVIVAVSDDPEMGLPAGRDSPLGSILEDRLTRAGWRIADPLEHGSAQRIVVLAATPQGWKGHGGVSGEATRLIRREVGSADRGLLVLLGHERWLDHIGVPGICAWSTESVMERAAADWIDRHAGGER